MNPFSKKLALQWSKPCIRAPLVFLALFAYTIIVYRSTLFDVPRSDHVAAFAILENLKFPADLSKIAFMELLGQARFQPLAWLFEFFQMKIFGLNFLLYHLFVVGLHALNGMLVFQVVHSLSRKTLFSFLTALVFVSLFSHMTIIAWPLVSYSLFSVTLSLLALLSLLKFYRSSRTVYLYLSYGIAFVALFFYELNVIVPAFIFLLSVTMGWSVGSRRNLIFKNLSLVAVSYVIYAALYLGLMPKYAGGFPEDITTGHRMLVAAAGVPIELFNTAFLHNVFASSKVIFGELTYFEPFTAKSFALTTMDPNLVKLNFAVYLALVALAVTMIKPKRPLILWILAAWAVGYTFMLFLGRHTSYVLSQARHAYFPSLLLVIIVAHFYEQYFTEGWSLKNNRGFSFLRKYGGVIVLIPCIFFVGLNTAKISWTLDDYMGYRKYPNAIYYAANDWLSKSENKDNQLFISVTTYPPHEKLAWGADIIPDLFLDNPRITKNYQQATHILEWKDSEDSPSITELSHSPENESSDDFAITFGLFTYQPVSEQYLEIFASSADTELESPGKRWWLRLYLEQNAPLPGGVAGIGRVALGYTEYAYSEGWVFFSQPIPIPVAQMTHFVLVREDKTFGLIVNGKLAEKTPDITNEDLRGLKLPLGGLYRCVYRKPYYTAHTFEEFGRSSFSIKDKEIGHVFENIHFDPMGGRKEHMTLNW